MSTKTEATSKKKSPHGRMLPLASVLERALGPSVGIAAFKPPKECSADHTEAFLVDPGVEVVRDHERKLIGIFHEPAPAAEPLKARWRSRASMAVRIFLELVEWADKKDYWICYGEDQWKEAVKA